MTQWVHYDFHHTMWHFSHLACWSGLLSSRAWVVPPPTPIPKAPDDGVWHSTSHPHLPGSYGKGPAGHWEYCEETGGKSWFSHFFDVCPHWIYRRFLGRSPQHLMHGRPVPGMPTFCLPSTMWLHHRIIPLSGTLWMRCWGYHTSREGIAARIKLMFWSEWLITMESVQRWVAD